MNIKIGKISAAVVQRVGNKANGDGIGFSQELCPMDTVESHLHKLIDSSFKYDNLKHFDAIDSVEYNYVYRFVKKIFKDNNCIIEQANNLARHLYEQSIHPNIKIGELYVVYFANCDYHGTQLDAVGLFKSENMETILKIVYENNTMRIVPEQGMSLHKLDKGCIIFNTDEEKGYKVSVVDNTNSKKDANYWIDNFLHVVDSNESYHNTILMVDLCTDYIRQIQNDGDAVAIAKVAKTTTQLLSSGESVSIEQITDILCKSQEEKEKFYAYKEHFEDVHGKISSKFTPEVSTFKHKPITKMNSVKLGNDFNLKILNPSAEIEHGYNKDKEMNYYTLYYKE